MKLRLFLFLFLACTLLVGGAMAQGCSVTTLAFPTDGGPNRAFNSEFCIASGTPGGTQTGRLRWDSGGDGRLQLFDTDDTGQSLWCAIDPMTNRCAVGSSLCLQGDGNMVIYEFANCGGNPLFASNTSNNNPSNPLCGLFLEDCNDDGEVLAVADNPVVFGTLRTGERGVIFNDTAFGSDERKQAIWFTSGFTDTD